MKGLAVETDITGWIFQRDLVLFQSMTLGPGSGGGLIGEVSGHFLS